MTLKMTPCVNPFISYPFHSPGLVCLVNPFTPYTFYGPCLVCLPNNPNFLQSMFLCLANNPFTSYTFYSPCSLRLANNPFTHFHNPCLVCLVNPFAPYTFHSPCLKPAPYREAVCSTSRQPNQCRQERYSRFDWRAVHQVRDTQYLFFSLLSCLYTRSVWYTLTTEQTLDL